MCGQPWLPNSAGKSSADCEGKFFKKELTVQDGYSSFIEESTLGDGFAQNRTADGRSGK